MNEMPDNNWDVPMFAALILNALFREEFPIDGDRKPLLVDPGRS